MSVFAVCRCGGYCVLLVQYEYVLVHEGTIRTGKVYPAERTLPCFRCGRLSRRDMLRICILTISVKYTDDYFSHESVACSKRSERETENGTEDSPMICNFFTMELSKRHHYCSLASCALVSFKVPGDASAAMVWTMWKMWTVNEINGCSPLSPR